MFRLIHLVPPFEQARTSLAGILFQDDASLSLNFRRNFLTSIGYCVQPRAANTAAGRAAAFAPVLTGRVNFALSL